MRAPARQPGFVVRETPPARQHDSPIQANGDGGVNVFPGNDGVGVGFMVRETTVEFCSLGISQGCGATFSGNAVPKIFDERQTFLDTEPVNT